MKTENTRIKTIKSPPLKLPKCTEHHHKTTKKTQNKSQTNKKQTKQINKKKHQKNPNPNAQTYLHYSSGGRLSVGNLDLTLQMYSVNGSLSIRNNPYQTDFPKRGRAGEFWLVFPEEVHP